MFKFLYVNIIFDGSFLIRTRKPMYLNHFPKELPVIDSSLKMLISLVSLPRFRVFKRQKSQNKDERVQMKIRSIIRLEELISLIF